MESHARQDLIYSEDLVSWAEGLVLPVCGAYSFGFLLILFLGFYYPRLSASELRTLVPKVWNGELLEADEGAFYLQGVIADSSARFRPGSFTFTLLGRKRQLLYQFQTDTQDLKDHPAKVWKLKEDEYDLMRVSLTDPQGHVLQWQGPYRHSFKISGQNLAHFGVWYLVQMQKGLLKVLAKRGKNVFRPEKSQGSFAAVIDGADGRILLNLKGSNAKTKAGQDQQELRQVFRSSRTISMVYKLNLFRQNSFAPAMAKTLEANDPDIRSCYLDHLEREPNAQGQLSYTFVYSSVTKSIKSLKMKQSDINDSVFLECMMYKLMGLDFPVGPSLIGELSFQFALSGS